MSLQARAAALEGERKALEDELPSLEGGVDRAAFDCRSDGMSCCRRSLKGSTLNEAFVIYRTLVCRYCLSMHFFIVLTRPLCCCAWPYHSRVVDNEDKGYSHKW